MSESTERSLVIDPILQPTASAVAGSTIYSMDGVRMDNIDGSKLAPYNFRNPGFLSHADLRQLGVLHQRFVQHLSARLSTFFRMECVLKITTFNSSTFSKFCESLANPTHLTLFQVEPLRGVGIVEISLPLGLTMADRLLGGKGRVGNPDRTLTEIEVALLEDAMQLIITEWSQIWEEQHTGFRTQCIGHETSGRFLQTSASDAVFVIMSVEVTLGEMCEQLQMGIPFSMIETMVKKMHLARQRGDDTRPKQIQWRAPYAGISVPITAEWKIRDITLGEVISMRAGDVIELPRELVGQTRVRLSNTEEFLGTVGMQNGHVAVQLGQRASKD
jgi:flagellar motor switch protein FliM